MADIFITGHRNPDMDSVCAAYAYAQLKNSVDTENRYIPVRCGHLSPTVKKQFALLGMEPPIYKRDVYAKVSDVMLEVRDRIGPDDPIYDLVRVYDPAKPSVYPVFDGERFCGLLSIDALNAWFLSDSATECPAYTLTISDLLSVLEGTLVLRGESETFTATVVTGGSLFASASDVKAPLVVTTCHDDFLRAAVEHDAPVIILSGCSSKPAPGIPASYHGTVLYTRFDTAEAIRRIRMATAVSAVIGPQGPALQATALFDEAREQLTASNRRGLSVFDGDKWVGFVTRRCFLRKPAADLILVDHNELGQSIRGVETARVREIIDHHRLNALKTDLPIFIDSEPLGSTCTIVYSQYQRHGHIPDAVTAKALLAGILCDTLILRSPTTTTADKVAAGSLAAISGEYDLVSFGRELFSVADTLASADPESAICADMKQYESNGIRFGIGQYETTTLSDIESLTQIYREALDRVAAKNALAWCMLIVTDVLHESSVLFITDHKLNRLLPYTKLSDGLYDMPGVLSRKKQLLPEILHTIEQS